MQIFQPGHCPCCNNKRISKLRNIQNYQYFKCEQCGSLFIDPTYLSKIDDGFNLVQYDQNYWNMEIPAAKERCFGANLARMAEAFYYVRIPVHKFLDIGTGTGYILDAISKLLPDHREVFYGVETYPPPHEYRTTSPNYIVGGLKDIDFKIDCGLCAEVIEHLTPMMLSNLFCQLAAISNPGALYIFNTGMPEYVLKEMPAYLEPTPRGHIVSYSIEAVSKISSQYGFQTYPLVGKTWAFAVEFNNSNPPRCFFKDRIWSALKENLDILCDKDMGDVLKILGLETARAYG